MISFTLYAIIYTKIVYEYLDISFFNTVYDPWGSPQEDSTVYKNQGVRFV